MSAGAHNTPVRRGLRSALAIVLLVIAQKYIAAGATGGAVK